MPLIDDLRARAYTWRLRRGWQSLTRQYPDVVLNPPMRGGVHRLARRIAECYEAADRLTSSTPTGTQGLLEDTLRSEAGIALTPTEVAALLLEVSTHLRSTTTAPLLRPGDQAHLARLCEHVGDPTLQQRTYSLLALFAAQREQRSRALLLASALRSQLAAPPPAERSSIVSQGHQRTSSTHSRALRDGFTAAATPTDA